MKEIELPSGKYLLVKVPEDANSFFIYNGVLWTDEKYPGLFSKKIKDDLHIIGKAVDIDIGTWENEDVIKNIPVSEQSTTLILKAK